MIKTLQEIQQENRLQIVHNCYRDKTADYKLDKLFKPITLSRVLLALRNTRQKVHDISFTVASEIYCEPWNLYPSIQGWEIIEKLQARIPWDLKKETIEEQSEEAQRQINRVLNDGQN